MADLAQRRGALIRLRTMTTQSFGGRGAKETPRKSCFRDLFRVWARPRIRDDFVAKSLEVVEFVQTTKGFTLASPKKGNSQTTHSFMYQLSSAGTGTLTNIGPTHRPCRSQTNPRPVLSPHSESRVSLTLSCWNRSQLTCGLSKPEGRGPTTCSPHFRGLAQGLNLLLTVQTQTV